MVCGGRRSGRWMSVCMLLDEPPRDSLGSARVRSAKIGSALRPPTPARDLSNTSFNNQIGFLHANGRSRWDLVRVRVSAVPGSLYHWYDGCIPHFWLPTVLWLARHCLVPCVCTATVYLCLCLLPWLLASFLSFSLLILSSFTRVFHFKLLTKGSLSMYKLFKGFHLYKQHSWLYIETTLLHPLNSLVMKYYS